MTGIGELTSDNSYQIERLKDLRKDVTDLFTSLALGIARHNEGQQDFRGYTLSSAATRWGSCSSDGRIRLNWRLIHFPLSIIDYVVAHELAHLREMNHSPRFWEVVRSVMPDYEQARGTLKDGVVPVFD